MSSERHKCAAAGCERQIALNLLMCPVHWARVPHATGAAVRLAWLQYRTNPSAATVEALRAAQKAAIDQIESRSTP